MLDPSSLNQLSQFKQDLREALNQQEATVRGTPATFGFARLDDGRDAFLNPEQMQRVLPGDRVLVALSEDNKKRVVATLVDLLDSPHREIVGFATARGQAWFIQAEIEQCQRRLFIPPNQRKGLREGTWLRARIRQHPFKDKRSSIETVKILGSSDTPGIYTEIALAREHLPGPAAGRLPKAAQSNSQREDLTATAFVTIDDAASRDLDDALYCEATDAGWLLQVAIADPAALFPASDTLDQEALARGQTLYFPDRVVGMLPEQIACEAASLHSGQSRPALVCRLQIDPQGQIRHSEFLLATVCVAERFDYHRANEALQRAESPLWKALSDCHSRMREQRGRDALLNANQSDFSFSLDAKGRLEGISLRASGPAHLCVEEAMVAVNRCAAEVLREAGVGLFTTHAGFRPDRVSQMQKILSEQLPDHPTDKLQTLEGYAELFRELSRPGHSLPLRAIAARLLRRAEISSEAGPHFGMGLQQYCTITSPIRRYTDLYNQRALTAVITGRRSNVLTDGDLASLRECLKRGRQAVRFTQRWLSCQFAEQHIGHVGPAEIVQTNGGGFVARLLDHGIEGQVSLADLPQKFRFDGVYFRHVGEHQSYSLEQTVTVRIESCDALTQQVNFSLLQDAATPAASDSP